MAARSRILSRVWPVLLNVYALALALVLVYPTIQLVIVAVSDDIVFPPRYFSLAPLRQLTPSFLASVRFSLILGAAATLLLLVLCLPTAYALERFRFRAQRLISVAMFIPFVVPGISYVAAVGALYIMLAPGMIGTFIGVLIPTSFLNLAWMARAIQGTLATADPVCEEAAMTLGATRLHSFLSITAPQIAPGILVGSMVVFVNTSTAFVVPFFVGGIDAVTATVEIFRELGFHGLTPVLAAQSLLVEVVVMAMVIAAYLVSRSRFRGLVL
ncbi:MAG TPA: ABC transporter permease subunit [Chloroflexota bacterium]|nr:ABC transporter permease subunit [Chloroflexota bacterium]